MELTRRNFVAGTAAAAATLGVASSALAAESSAKKDAASATDRSTFDAPSYSLTHEPPTWGTEHIADIDWLGSAPEVTEMTRGEDTKDSIAVPRHEGRAEAHASRTSPTVVPSAENGVPSSSVNPRRAHVTLRISRGFGLSKRGLRAAATRMTRPAMMPARVCISRARGKTRDVVGNMA